MNEPEIDPGALRLAAALADGTPIDWQALPEGVSPSQALSFRVIDSVLRDYERAAGEVRAQLQRPLLPADSKWGPLRVLEPIGAGSFGQVFRAFDRSLHRDVALKILRDAPRSADGVPEFLEEARRLARVRHPGVLQVFGVAVHRRRAGIWTELVQGRTLEDILEKGGPLEPRVVAQIGIDLCGALSAIHGVGLIHCDVKAENVIREESGRLVLTDFGAADDRFDLDAEPSGLGSLLSTAPEVLRGERPGPGSDIYGLGILLYRLLIGSYPRSGETVEELILAFDRHTAPLREVRPEVPAELASVVDRAIDREPGRRFMGPNAMAQALQSVLHPERPVVRTIRESYRPPTPPGSLLKTVSVAAAMCLVIAWSVLGVAIPWLSHYATPFPPPPQPAKTVTEVAVPPAGLRAQPVLYRISSSGSEPLADGSVIRNGDQLGLHVETDAAPVYAYVLDADQAGHQFLLFPLPGYSASNPLGSLTTYRLPDRPPGSRGLGHTWQVNSEGGTESLTLVTSLVRLAWLERMLRDLPRPSDANESRMAAASEDPGTTPRGLRTRGMGQTAPAPPSTAMAATLDRLRASDELRQGKAAIWQIRLEAPRP